MKSIMKTHHSAAPAGYRSYAPLQHGLCGQACELCATLVRVHAGADVWEVWAL